MANTQYTTEQLAERFIDRREIQNTIGKYVFATMICKHADIVDRFWAKDAESPALGLNDGWYVGLDAIRGYYAAVSQNIMAKSKLIQKLFPEKTGDKSEEEMFGAGCAYPRPLTTEIVEVAGDGQTAKGLWQVMGLDTDITERGPLSLWKWGYAAADFALENGEWKVWHLKFLDELTNPAGSDWTKEQPYPTLPEFHEIAELTVPAPTVPCELHKAYSPDRPFAAPPAYPVPYRAFADTFSYGL